MEFNLRYIETRLFRKIKQMYNGICAQEGNRVSRNVFLTTKKVSPKYP